MKHLATARYPAPAAVVVKMFADKDFHTRKLDAMAGVKYEVLEHSLDGKDFRIKIERRVPMEAPAAIRKFLPSETRVVHEERWNIASKTGRVVAQPQGVPVDMSCTATMADEGKGCVITYNWEIKAKLPFMGALEKFISADMDKRSDEETRLGITFLDQYR